MRLRLVLTACLVFHALNGSALAECSLDGKIAHISYTSRYSPSTVIRYTLRFLGSRIYSGNGTGDVYRLGETIERYKDPATNTPAHRVEAPHHSLTAAGVGKFGVSVRADTISAARNGDTIVLTYYYAYTTSVDQGTEVAVKDKLSVSFPQCTSCAVSDAHTTSYVNGTETNGSLDQSLVSQSCTLN